MQSNTDTKIGSHQAFMQGGISKEPAALDAQESARTDRG